MSRLVVLTTYLDVPDRPFKYVTAVHRSISSSPAHPCKDIPPFLACAQTNAFTVPFPIVLPVNSECIVFEIAKLESLCAWSPPGAIFYERALSAAILWRLPCLGFGLLPGAKGGILQKKRSTSYPPSSSTRSIDGKGLTRLTRSHKPRWMKRKQRWRPCAARWTRRRARSMPWGAFSPQRF